MSEKTRQCTHTVVDVVHMCSVLTCQEMAKDRWTGRRAVGTEAGARGDARGDEAHTKAQETGLGVFP